MTTKKQHSMERIGTVNIQEVLQNIGDFKRLFLGQQVKMNSIRYLTFSKKGCSCVECGIIGKYFAVERHPNTENPYHLNLYAIDDQGDEVLITVDHIIPACKGGKRILNNLQPMCVVCNMKKGSKNEVRCTT